MTALHAANQYVVYCDESCHQMTTGHDFMGIGGLWVPRHSKRDLSRGFRDLCRSVGLGGEVKWQKVSQRKLEGYERLVDFFSEHEELRFRIIVVDHREVDLEAFHDSDAELAFYKFYYEMLVKWLERGNQYLILLDHKSNRGADRYGALRRCLEGTLGASVRILDLTAIDSKETPLAQLCDLLTGAVTAAYNRLRAGTAKEKLAGHIASRVGLPSLNVGTHSRADKFNIFRIRLRGADEPRPSPTPR